MYKEKLTEGCTVTWAHNRATCEGPCGLKVRADILRPLDFADIGRDIHFDRLCKRDFWAILDGLRATREAYISDKAKREKQEREAVRMAKRVGQEQYDWAAIDGSRVLFNEQDEEAKQALQQLADEARGRKLSRRKVRKTKSNDFSDIEAAMLKAAGEI